MFSLVGPVDHHVRDTTTMESFTMLDRDTLLLNATDHDIFVAIQPHTIMGNISSVVEYSNGEKTYIAHKNGDTFLIQDAKMTLYYTKRGGCTIKVWQIPKGMCSEYSIFSTQQREADIFIDDKFAEEKKICWFLAFRKQVSFQADHSENTKLYFGDNSGIAESSSGLLNQTMMIALHAAPGHSLVKVHVQCNISYGDWTDSPRFFTPINQQNKFSTSPMYIETKRNVELWIWVVMFSILASLFTFTVVIFFIKPITKIHKSFSLPEDLNKLAPVTTKKE